MKEFVLPDELFAEPGDRPALILCLEDNAQDFQLIRETLVANDIACRLTNVKRKEEFQTALADTRFDLIISDFSLPDYDGLSALAFARIVQPEAPFLFVSGTIGSERAARSLQCGAAGFVLKDLIAERLPPVVRYALLAPPEEDEQRPGESDPAAGHSFERAEPRPGEQQTLQSAALAAVANGIMITDRQGVIRWVNPAFSRLTGYRPEEILGNRPGMFNSGKHDELFYRQFWNTILAGQTWRGEFINRRRDGSLYIVEQTVTPMLQDGEVTHFISVSEDVTGRKQLEEQLRQAQKFQAIGQLAAGVAHEFNNLLTVIHCNSELLLTVEDRLTPAESKSLLQHMIAVSEHGANLTRRLGVFCREQVLQREPLNLNETIETLASMLRRSISENILWQFNCTPNLPFVCADAALIQQVITNLVWNAIDAMPRGGRLILSTERTTINAGDPRHHPGTGGGEFVSLSISDTGCGIAPENLTRLFEPFFSTKEVGKGTGLGLAMAYGIVKQHQGWIDVTSELDRGTVFKVFLPAIAEPAGPTADQTARG